jgi:hypothetical protein
LSYQQRSQFKPTEACDRLRGRHVRVSYPPPRIGPINFWRPITAIRNGDIDANPDTDRDATWQPIDTTPNGSHAVTSSCSSLRCHFGARVGRGNQAPTTHQIAHPAADAVLEQWRRLNRAANKRVAPTAGSRALHSPVLLGCSRAPGRGKLYRFFRAGLCAGLIGRGAWAE